MVQTVTEQPVETDQSDQSSLERPLDVRNLPAEWLAWIGVLLVMLAIRLIGRTSWPLSPGESGIAYDAWLLNQGNDVSAAADAHPFIVQVTGLMFFLFGATDYTARLVPFIAGIGIVATLFWLRRWIGNLPALSTAIVWTLSPVMAMGSLRIDGGTVLALSSLLILGTVFVMAVEPGPGKPVVLGVSMAVAITAHPIGWLVVVFTLLPALWLIRQPRLTGYFTRLGVGFIVTFLLSVTWFASRPTGLVDFFRESFGALWSDHLLALGSDWPLTVLVLLVEEPMALVLAIIALVLAFARPPWPASAHPALIISCAAWAIPMLTLGILLNGKGPAIYTATLFPLLLVAGMGLSTIIEGLWMVRHDQKRAAALWGLIVVGLVLAILRFVETLITGPIADTVTWSISVAALALLIVLPLGYAAIRLTPRVKQHVLPATLLILVVLLSVPALRNAILLTSTDTDQTGEVLLAGATTPAVGELQGRISRYSRDVTMYDQDVRDPVGGHGLVLALDERLRDPFQWYFRRFPDMQIVSGPDELVGNMQPDMVFVSETNRDDFQEHLDGYRQRSYPTRFELAATDETPDYVSLLARAANPLEFGSLMDFVVRRNGATLLDVENATLMIREDHVDSFWGELAE